MPSLTRPTSPRAEPHYGAVPQVAMQEAARSTIRRWHATATRALANRTPVDGVCLLCRRRWPCPTCERAAFALEAQ